MLVAAALSAFSTGLQAQSHLDLKSITIAVGSSAGGGYDTYARVLACHMTRHVPGQPNIIVQNMPGASSLKAVQYLDSNAPKDGSVIAAFNPGLITESLLNAEKIRFRFSEVTRQHYPRPSRLLRLGRDRNQVLGRFEEDEAVQHGRKPTTRRWRICWSTGRNLLR